ncbi:MarR family transcriptional regulator [Devosia rhodophyticola]|uniref:MarR family transcriptional regulator n=1 Tax=Devosia rhodophyticola TaxID=3026423 RepID=A0ABY7YX17_9HYPH|nr:MarR family transcriptional regulator [Devosia rhodophyticola]WDR05930.1 MarR family transcriptional regulator [Devosia rhodophyticola]
MKRAPEPLAEDLKPLSMADIAPRSFLVVAVAKQFRRAFEMHAKRHDLTLPQWRVLAQLAASGGLTQATLSSLVETDPMTVSGVLDRLETRGLVVRTADANDSRAKIASAAPSALKLIEELKVLAVSVSEDAFAGVSESERTLLVSALTKVSQNLSGHLARREDQ